MEPDRDKNILNRFDIVALLKFLENKGYPLENLIFCGNMSLKSTSSLCSNVECSPETASASVTFNLGLLTGNSPLPSYFRKCMENGEIDEENFVNFLQFFNHHLIKKFLMLTWVEKFLVEIYRESHEESRLTKTSDAFFLTDQLLPHHNAYVEEWKEIRLSNLMMLGLDSISSIHWVFSLCFPELELKVKKCVKSRKVSGHDFFLGVSQLGSKNALGGYMVQTTPAYSVSLTSDIEQTDNRVFWPTEIRSRLRESIFPLIWKTHIYLIISFTINQYNRALYLNRQSLVGYNSLGEATSNFTWLIWEGYGI